MNKGYDLFKKKVSEEVVVYVKNFCLYLCLC